MSFNSINAIASRIFNEIEGGWIYDNSRINIRMLEDKVHATRAKLLGERYGKKIGAIPGQYYALCCIDFVCVDACDNPESGVKILRATIPPLIGSIGRKAIRYIGTVDRKTSFEWRSSYEANDYTSFLPFASTRKDPYVLITGDKADLYNPPTYNLKKAVIIGIFGDPTACGDCEDKDKRYNIPEDHISDIEKYVKADIAGLLLQRRVDKINNANPDS